MSIEIVGAGKPESADHCCKDTGVLMYVAPIHEGNIGWGRDACSYCHEDLPATVDEAREMAEAGT